MLIVVRLHIGELSIIAIQYYQVRHLRDANTLLTWVNEIGKLIGVAVAKKPDSPSSKLDGVVRGDPLPI
jgi:hypothetical protein